MGNSDDTWIHASLSLFPKILLIHVILAPQEGPSADRFHTSLVHVEHSQYTGDCTGVVSTGGVGGSGAPQVALLHPAPQMVGNSVDSRAQASRSLVPKLFITHVMRSPHVNPSAFAFHTLSVHRIHPQCKGSDVFLIVAIVGTPVVDFDGFKVGALVRRRIDDARVVKWMVSFLPAFPFPFLWEYCVAETVWFPLCESVDDGKNTLPLVSPSKVYGAIFSIRTRCLPFMSNTTDAAAGSGDEGLALIVSLLPTSLKYMMVPFFVIVPKFAFVTVSMNVKLSMYCADTETDAAIMRFHAIKKKYIIVIVFDGVRDTTTNRF